MSDKDRLASRIPAEKLHNVASWVVPQVHSKGESILSAQLEEKQQIEAEKAAVTADDETIECLETEEKPQLLTAEELLRISEEARREGYEVGYKEGSAKGESEGHAKGLKSGETKAFQQTLAKRNEEIKRLKTIADALFQPMQDQQAQLENIVVDIAVSLAKQLVLQELQQRPSVLYDIVSHALSALPAGSENICIHLNPSDAELFAELPTHPQWRIQEDPSISPGGCRVSTDVSLVDFTLEPRIDAYLNQVRSGGDIDEASLPEPTVFRDEPTEMEAVLDLENQGGNQGTGMAENGEADGQALEEVGNEKGQELKIEGAGTDEEESGEVEGQARIDEGQEHESSGLAPDQPEGQTAKNPKSKPQDEA